MGRQLDGHVDQPLAEPPRGVAGVGPGFQEAEVDAAASLEKPEVFRQVLQDLRLHEIELEMQNEELRRAQVELDVLRARYFDLYDLAPIGYCTLSKAGVIIQTNLAAANLLGLSRTAGIGRAFARFIDVQDQGVMHGLLQRASLSGGQQSAELRMFSYESGQFWAHLVVSAGQDAGGTAEWRLVLSDITPRKQAETGRREVEARYRELFCRAIDGIVVCSALGLVENVNESFCRMHGWPAAEFCGANLRKVDTSGVVFAPERMGQMLAGEVVGFEVDHRHRDGHSLQLEASTSLIFVTGTPRLLAYYRPRRTSSQAGP